MDSLRQILCILVIVAHANGNAVDAAVRSASMAVCNVASLGAECLEPMRNKLGPVMTKEKEFCRIKDLVFNETLSCVRRVLENCSLASHYKANVQRQIDGYNDSHECNHCSKDMEKIHADCALDDLPPDISENERCWALQSEIYCAQNETEGCDREHEVEDYYACRVDDYNYEYSCQITTSGVCIDVISDFCHLGDVTSCAPLGALSRPEAGRVLHALEFDMSSTDLCKSLNKLDQPKEVLQCWLKACLPEESGDKVVKEMLSACDSVMQTTEEPRSSSSTGSDVISSPPPTADISLTVIDVESIKMLRPTANKFVKKGPVSERDMTSPSGTAGLANQKYFATILCFGVVFFFMENM